jgi:hypothetical protein
VNCVRRNPTNLYSKKCSNYFRNKSLVFSPWICSHHFPVFTILTFFEVLKLCCLAVVDKVTEKAHFLLRILNILFQRRIIYSTTCNKDVE